MEEAETLCQRIGIIDYGKLLAEGTLSQLQERLGEGLVFTLEADFRESLPAQWEGFAARFRVLQKSESQLVVAAVGQRDPSDCLKELLALPVRLRNVSLKRPSLNDVFLQLTGRQLGSDVLRALIAKDLRRAWRNPLPWMLNLALPIVITVVIGMVFGGQGGDGNSLGRIKFAVVDEDKSPLADFLRGAANQGERARHLEPVFLERPAAEQQLKDAKLSAILVIPAGFASNYLSGGKVQLELVKNPAEQIHPAVLEELLEVVVSGLNAVSRNFNSQFPAWRKVIEGEGDYHEVSRLVEETATIPGGAQVSFSAAGGLHQRRRGERA